MSIDWEIEEGCYEYDKGHCSRGLTSSSTISILDCDEVAIYGHFNFDEIEATYLKMKELQSEVKK